MMPDYAQDPEEKMEEDAEMFESTVTPDRSPSLAEEEGDD